MISQSITILLNEVREAYIQDQKAKGLRSSGKSAESLRIVTRETSGELWGAKYWTQQKLGRKPGKFPPISAILDWIRAKGIGSNDIPERSLAFLIARKIAQSGTDIFQGKRQGIDVEDRIEELVKEFRGNLVKDIKAKIIKALS